MTATPYSYRQYAGNGSTKSFAVPFPYLLKSHVHVYLGFNVLDGTYASELAETTGYSWTSGTAIQTVTAPATGQTLTVIRQTPNSQQVVEWQDGSTLIAADLNTSDLQNLYVVQEQQDRNDAGIAVSLSSQANSAAAAAAAANSATAVAAATSAVASATTAANNAVAASTVATNTANTALANSQAAQAIASGAVATANSANTTAGTATATAATATATANAAVTTANSANSKADQAIAAISSSINYTLIANVAAIPASAANETYIEVGNSTGIENFTPLTGKPSGFVGGFGLAVRLRYTTAGATWNWIGYYANNPEALYLKLSGGTLTGPLTLSGAPTSSLHPANKAYVDGYVGSINGDIASLSSAKLDASTAASTYQTQAGMSSYAPLSNPVFTGSPVVPGYLQSATAASTYQTQAGMSLYLTTAAANATYQSLSGMSSYAALGITQSFTKAQRGAVVALTDGATITPDFSLGNNYSITLGGNRTLANPTNLTAGQSGTIVITQDATGSRTLAFGSYFKFPGGTAPTLTTTANAVDVIAYYVESTTRIIARIINDVK